MKCMNHERCGCTGEEILFDLLLKVYQKEVEIMATQQDLDAAQSQTAQTVAQLKADVATLTDLVTQLIAKIGSGTPPLDLAPEVTAEAAINTDVGASDTAVQASITAAKTALGQ